MTTNQYAIFSAILVACSTTSFWLGIKSVPKDAETDVLGKRKDPVEINVIASAKDSNPIVQIMLVDGAYVCQLTSQNFDSSESLKRTSSRFNCVDMRDHN